MKDALPISTDNTGGHESETRELFAEAESYETAASDLRSQVPEGWRIMNFRRR